MTTISDLPRRPRGRPAHNGLDYADTKALLIRCGVELLTQYGVSATVIDDVLKRVQVPKGSFYHYFASKDAFVDAAVEAYADYFARKLNSHFQNQELAPLARISAFVDEACAGVERHDFTRGCLVGNLGQEVSCLSPNLRQRLEDIFCDWEHRLEQCLQEAIASGDLDKEADCAALAHVFWIGWEGAVLRARLVRSCGPMKAFLDLFMQALPPA
ncbi:TetR family transcriptional regulator C-terminal domain-containing protein [Chitinibacter fontanus]|uniref:TetR family transcriptional regulator C-terminal domain-containing protein n=1 Tax=Chitinibacter fontanus TaxID=1737446 RepID=A0A7D5ZFR6_9NEIS|nr:TetR/AcrR family transcriptional regulator [Chitinibacter fontanus]QLI82284.1 TetR family transcriptional regulator C-terminal domain-containing protein [Chitinibacter fontanus]